MDALGDIGGKTATRLLQQALADQENFIREAAAENLAELMRPSQFSEREVDRTEAAEGALQHQGADHPGYQQPVWIDKIAEERTQQYQRSSDAVMQTCIITHDCLPLSSACC